MMAHTMKRRVHAYELGSWNNICFQHESFTPTEARSNLFLVGLADRRIHYSSSMRTFQCLHLMKTNFRDEEILRSLATSAQRDCRGFIGLFIIMRNWSFSTCVGGPPGRSLANLTSFRVRGREIHKLHSTLSPANPRKTRQLAHVCEIFRVDLLTLSEFEKHFRPDKRDENVKSSRFPIDTGLFCLHWINISWETSQLMK